MNLKQVYETARGQPISDRQWRTIVCQLDLGMLLDPVAAVRTAAWLRRVAPKARLSRNLVIQVKDMERAFPLDACMTREDLWAVIQDRLPVYPSLPTLYRWGDELGHTRSDQILLPEDIRFWLLKLLSWRTKPHGNYQTNRQPSQSFVRNRSAKAA